jgi:hypothetical protein
MSQNNNSHLLIFACVLGLFVYVASALWSAFFVVDVPQAPDAVVHVEEITRESGRYDWRVETEVVPVSFSSTLEELKYHHNVRMLERNRYWLYGTLVFGAFAGVLSFCLIPRWRRSSDVYRGSESCVGGAFFGAFVALVVPAFLGWLLPPPADWFPSQIREAADLRQQEALAVLQQQASGLRSIHPE